MRRKELEVTDRGTIKKILEACKIVHLGMVDGGVPYVVPMNFTMEMDEAECVFYFHSANEGRKIDVMRKSPEVCLEACLYAPSGSSREELAPGTDARRYQCVIGTGKAEFVEDLQEKARLLAFMGQRHGRKPREYPESFLQRICVFKVRLDELACKQH